MNGVVTFAKEHPVMVGASVLAIVAAVVLFSGGGETEGTAVAVPGGGMDDAAMMAGIQIQGAQIAAQSRAAEVAAAERVALSEHARDLEIATLASQATNNANTLAASIALQGIGAEERLGTLTTTLQAKIEGDRIAADAAETAGMYATIHAQTAAQVKLAETYANAQIEGARIGANANAAAAESARLRDVSLAEINARPKGLFSLIFG